MVTRENTKRGRHEKTYKLMHAELLQVLIRLRQAPEQRQRAVYLIAASQLL
jgi:hypothetical protein